MTSRGYQVWLRLAMAWCLLGWTTTTRMAAMAFSHPEAAAATAPMKVLVTGAAGKTGRLVLKKLEEDPRYEPKGLVRSEASARRLLSDADIRCPLEHMVVSDVTSPTFEETFPTGLQGLDAMIICTSAVPRIRRRSLLQAVVKVPWNILRRRPPVDFRTLQFKWKHDGYPERVDYHGQVAQFNLAKKLGMKRVVVISSMGGTNPDNFLNRVGKNKDGTGNGDILLWKRKAEMYLVESGLSYAIIHPGGLVDTPGGKEEFVLDIDDKISTYHDRTRISREDVADLCVAALRGTQNCSFDCITIPPSREMGEARINGEEKGSSSSLQRAEQALADFLQKAKTANYAI